MIEAIKEQYPHPCTVEESNALAGAYCVGGAVCHYFGSWITFPTEDELRVILLRANPKLSPWDARFYALDIIKANDCEDFDKAWMLAAEALGDCCD